VDWNSAINNPQSAISETHPLPRVVLTHIHTKAQRKTRTLADINGGLN